MSPKLFTLMSRLVNNLTLITASDRASDSPSQNQLAHNIDLQKKIASISSHRQRGHFIESIVKDWLQDQGIVIIEQNFTTPLGEIDLIGQDRQGCLIFFEVKHRTHQRYGSAAEQVTLHKQNRIRKVAEQFIQQRHPTKLPQCRFDVICTETNQLWVNWIKAAF